MCPVFIMHVQSICRMVVYAMHSMYGYILYMYYVCVVKCVQSVCVTYTVSEVCVCVCDRVAYV